ncbi:MULTISPECIES: hypothetical protein [Klebsiella]|uniref:hypothetical protein n=1 Tax=Klebsiella TaxID=570 RepID=UPI0006E6F0ED|nr:MULTISPECIES: hypothetical protein [Klebsiella]MDX6056125.1 hypothetical protein [Klebsiella sp. JN_Kp126]NMD79634.1 hypothetical protein [Klebsiella sp. DNRA6]OEG95880.1 hypothetical protein AN700_0209640 [Klebsiella michiganensis]
MYLVKSCSKQNNPKTSGTLRIGSLTEYRDSENKEVEDREEGFYRINIDLKDKWITTNLFSHLNKSHLSLSSVHIHHLALKGSYEDRILVDYHANYTWDNLNRFIFCITKTERAEDAQNIFSGYDDSWSIDYKKITWMKKAMEKNVLQKVKELISSGEMIFGSDFNDPGKIRIQSYTQDIIYQARDLYLGNKDIDAMSETLISLFENVKFIKPVDFKKEKELRFVFDFYYDGIIIFPQINSLIVPATGIIELL